MAARKQKKPKKEARDYSHKDVTSPMRPEIGTQASFKKKQGPVTYRYDSSLAPELQWDEGLGAREEGESLIREMLEASSLEQARETAEKLRRMSAPFLNWAGKAERTETTIPTLPLFIHERLSTKAIIETLTAHKTDKQIDLPLLFADPQHSIRDQVLRAYEHRDQWVNRLILGDSLVVMNSLLKYESLGGQVQMIYMDPPYGVKFGSNFQPFVRKRDVRHDDDEELTREPEMVKAYRDTWELGLHSYMTYLRDRLLLCRGLLRPSGSLFVQISDENVHHVREVMDEVFGAENFVGMIMFVTTTSQTSTVLASIGDYLLWYAKDRQSVKFHQLFVLKDPKATGGWALNYVELPDGTRRPLTTDERKGLAPVPEGGRLYMFDNLTSQGATETGTVPFELAGVKYHPGRRSHWKTTIDGLQRLAEARRVEAPGTQIRYVRFFDDFPVQPISNIWTDTTQAGYVDEKIYAVQTVMKVVQRCILMTTDPGDLVLDPTCGGGTTAYVSEQWGRRWIAIDVSRVPLALARQRVLTATFPWYELSDEERGPAAGFVYKREGESGNSRNVGPGIVQHITLRSIANAEPSDEEVLVDRPEHTRGIARVSGPFVVEGTIPIPVDWEGDGEEDSGVASSHADHVSRMLEVLRLSPVLHLGGGKTVKLTKVRPPAKTLSLSAEAIAEDGDAPVAFVFGPENGAINETLVHNAAREASAKSYAHLYVVGFAIQPDARRYVEDCDSIAGVPATYVQATPDLLMGDLLKNMRSSQIFSVCGLPEVRIFPAKGKSNKGKLQVELLGLDVFDPITMDTEHREGDDVPAWFLDTHYNGTCFHVCEAFFPRTSAWDSLKKALKGEYDETVWEHLAGTVSAPFNPGETGQIAVKVIDDRGNELMVVQSSEGVL